MLYIQTQGMEFRYQNPHRNQAAVVATQEADKENQGEASRLSSRLSSSVVRDPVSMKWSPYTYKHSHMIT